MERKIYRLYSINQNRLSEAELIIEDIVNSYSIHFISEEYNSGIIKGDNLFDAMKVLHSNLENRSLKLLCNSFRYDIMTSGMSRSMGSGRLAYKLVLGKQGTELVDIFDTTDDVSAIVSLNEKEEYFKKWISSLSE